MTNVQAIANATEVSATATATLDMSNLVDLALRLFRPLQLLEVEEVDAFNFVW